MIPHLVIVGADKGGVGKTTVSRALMDYYKARAVDHIAFDTETPFGVLKRFFPDQTIIVDLTTADGQMTVFDKLGDHAINIIDVRAGLLSPTLVALSKTGFLDRMKANQLKVTVLHILGSTQASFDEIKAAASIMHGSRHIIVTNYINESAYVGLTQEMKSVSSGEIVIKKLTERAAEYVDQAGVSFQEYIDGSQKVPAHLHSMTLEGYVHTWLSEVFLSFDGVQLAAIG